VVTLDGKPVSGGRVGAWMKLRSMERINAEVHRGRVVERGGYEFAWSKVGPDGQFAIDGLKPGPWYLAYEEPGKASTVVGPVTLKKGAAQAVDIAVTPGATIEGKVEHIPYGMAGAAWVVLYDDGVVDREVRVAPDGTFRLEGLPPGRYGLKVGHDGYEDPHSLMSMKVEDFQIYREFIFGPAEPWLGAVVVEVKAGQASRGVVLDFKPPTPFVLPEPKAKEEKPEKK
jgi:hypothetical protein